MNEINDLLTRKEELNPVLRPYIQESRIKGWRVLHHPLVISLPYDENMNAWINRSFAEKSKRAMEDFVNGNFSAYVGWHERPYRVEAFMHCLATGRLTPEKYWPLVGYVWTDSENIRQNLGQWRKIWTMRLLQRELVMEPPEREVLAKLPNTIEVFRGVRHDSSVGGMSWTLLKDKAIWFANAKSDRDGGQGLLVRGIVNKPRVLAYLDARDEQEIVALPSFVRHRTVTQV